MASRRRGSFISPLSKLRAHARAVKGMITGGQVRARQPDLARIWAEPLVVLTAGDAVLDDPAGKDSSQTTTLADLIDVLGDTSRVQRGAPPGTRFRCSRCWMRSACWSSRVLARCVSAAGRSVSASGATTGSRSSGRRTPMAPAASGTVLLRVYEADVYLSDAGLQAQRLRLGNAFEALSGIPQHPNVVRAFTFFPDDDESRFVLVLDDPRATALRVHLNRPQLALTADARMRVMRGCCWAWRMCTGTAP